MVLPTPQPEPGPLLIYIESLPPEIARNTLTAVRALLQTAEGRILMDLMDKSTKDRIPRLFCDPRALDARHAQSFIAADLRRIADETEYVDARPKSRDVEQPRSRRERRSAE
jgi:hypothetical protein